MADNEKNNQEEQKEKEGKRESLTKIAGKLKTTNFSKRRNFANYYVNQLNVSSTATTIGEYTQEDVRTLIEDYQTESSQSELQDISEVLYMRSPHYKRLIHYFAGMPTFSHAIVPKKGIESISRDKVAKDYTAVAEYLKLMNIKHEFHRVLIEVFKVGVFFGYVNQTKDDFYIQKLPRQMCKISSVEDGVFNFSVDMNYVNDNIDTFKYTMPEEIISLYNEWLSTNSTSRNRRSRSTTSTSRNRRNSGSTSVQKSDEFVAGDWVPLDSRNTICIKFDEENYNVYMPPFAGSFDSIFEIDGYKASRRNKEELDNYMLLYQKIPMRADTDLNNDFTVDYDDVLTFHASLVDNAPDNVGVVSTPMELKPIEFNRDSIDVDNVSKSERDFWSGNGTSQALFSTEASTTQGINRSINTDEQMVFPILRQIERWINRYLRFSFKTSSLNVMMMEVTYFNQQDFYKRMLEASQYGTPVKTLIPASLGLEPIQVEGLAYLENTVLEIHTEWIPLKSSHTTSSADTEENTTATDTTTTDNTGGRPETPVEELSDESLRSLDKQS